jgi:hypothetical protein
MKKLTRFELEKMPVAEMNAIKAGSGTCTSGLLSTSSSTGETDTMSSDSDAD